MNLANAITLARLASAPLIVHLILDGLPGVAFWLFTLAGLSDAVDGYLARHHGMASPLGRLLDPIADKVLLVSVYAAMGWCAMVPLWLAILVISRDMCIIGAIILSVVRKRLLTIRPIGLSRVNTAAQIGLVAWQLGHFAFGGDLAGDPLTPVLIWIVAGTTILSWGRYVAIWLAVSGAFERS